MEFLNLKKEVRYMEMKNKLLNYIDDCGISVDNLSEQLQISRDKFDKNNKKNWNAEDLLRICAYLKVDPMGFYIKKL